MRELVNSGRTYYVYSVKEMELAKEKYKTILEAYNAQNNPHAEMFANREVKIATSCDRCSGEIWANIDDFIDGKHAIEITHSDNFHSIFR